VISEGNAQDTTPTSRWLATVAERGMPPLEGPEGTAERLLLLIHYGIDWRDGWVTRYRKTYWTSVLPDRVVSATFFSRGSLRGWWQDVCNELESVHHNTAQRAELEMLLRADSLPVLEALRDRPDALLLRTRIVTDAVRSARAEQTALAAGAVA
jgi:hypothetical protein